MWHQWVFYVLPAVLFLVTCYLGGEVAHFRRKWNHATQELRIIDEALARRPALKPYPTRYSKIEYACYYAGKYENIMMTKQSEERRA